MLVYHSIILGYLIDIYYNIVYINIYIYIVDIIFITYETYPTPDRNIFVLVLAGLKLIKRNGLSKTLTCISCAYKLND